MHPKNQSRKTYLIKSVNVEPVVTSKYIVKQQETLSIHVLHKWLPNKNSFTTVLYSKIILR